VGRVSKEHLDTEVNSEIGEFRQRFAQRSSDRDVRGLQ
jgi:hypothetical protein